MKNTIKINILVAVILPIAQYCNSQGFFDLNFESASLSGLSENILPTTSAFPDWSAYFGPSSDPTYSGSISTVSYDGVSLGGANICLADSSAPSGGAPLPLQGNYSAYLQGSAPSAETAASLGQTGTIPSTAESITFWANVIGNLDVSFDGQELSLIEISNELNYAVYAINIASYAGQTGQLLFTTPPTPASGGVNYAEIDNIQFSTSPVPEPSECALIGLGALLLGFRHRRKHRTSNIERPTSNKKA